MPCPPLTTETPRSSLPGKSTGASLSRCSLAMKAPASPKRSSAAPTRASTFLWPAALNPSTPPPPPRSSSTKPPASATRFRHQTSNLQTLRVLQENREPLLQIARFGRGRRHPRRQSAARRAHASAHARRIHRPGKTSRPRQAAAPANRKRQHWLDALLGPAGLRQNHARASYRAADARRVRLLQRR